MVKSTGPSSPEAAVLKALAELHRTRQFDALYQQATVLVARFPQSFALHSFAGAAARALGFSEKAERAFETALRLAPEDPGSHFNLALLASDQGDLTTACARYRAVLAIDADHVQALNNLGSLLTLLDDIPAAIAALNRARAVSPRSPEVHISLGNAFKRAGRIVDARAAYGRALEADPACASAYGNLGALELEHGDLARAGAAYRAALACEPEHAALRVELLHLLAKECDWDAIAAERPLIAQMGVTTPAVAPFGVLALEDHPERQLERSRKWAARQCRSAAAPMPARPRTRPERLRIGIFGSDFHDHPAMHLMAGLLGAIDRERFELHAFNYGHQPEDAYRRQARNLVDEFHDVAGWSDARIVARAHAAGIDIALDRKGHTTGSRVELFAGRPAPVQIHYLAYPGTVCVPAIDYMIADPVVVPSAQRCFVAERVIFLPHCYQPNNDQRPIAPLATERGDHGLPEQGFVFCCFNATYKITPREFAIWMRLLHAINGSVLWLYRDNDRAVANLQKHAAQHGIDPARLVFAPRMPSPEHLARHVHADLFLDCFAMGAHTTASDALWAGLPVVARAGEQFAARVSASLLRAVGLPELVTETDAQYETLIVALAEDRPRLAALRARLAANRQTPPLFDTALYARHFESGLTAAWERWYAGLEPADIVVNAV